MSSSILWRETLSVRWWSLWRIPILCFVSPRVLELNSQRCSIRIPLNWRTRNHLGSMYFGVLCIGADSAAGLIAMRAIQNRGGNVSLIFKDFRAEFLKRPENDVVFTCGDGDELDRLVERVIDTRERGNLTVHVDASVPSISSDEVVARFELTISLKYRPAGPKR